MSGTSGTIPYESKKHALQDFGRKRTAGQCEPFSALGSALIMTVLDCVTVGGNISNGKTTKNDLTSFNVHNICVVFMFFNSKIRSDRSRGIYTIRIIVSR